MNEAERKSRNQTRLLDMHPAFRVRLEAVLKELESLGYRPRIESSWRSPQEQAEAYRLGRSRVTYGFHNVTATNGAKEALAADVWDDNDFAHQKTPYMLHLLASAEANGLTTGLRWELTSDKVETINKAIAMKSWNTPVYTGFDPLHVEITGLTIDDVKAGKRPLMPGEAPASAGSTPADTGTTSTTPMPYDGKQSPTTTPAPVKPAHYKVENLDTGLSAEYTWSTAFKPVVLLPVPYVSQFGAGADAHKNDCGAASAIMLLRAYLNIQMTPDEFYTKFAISGDPFLSVAQLRNAMSSLGLLTDFRATLTMQDLFGALAAGTPPIVLLRYKVLEEAGLTEKTFDGPHFAVVVGMDIKNVYIHDPLYTNPANGEAHAYPLELFWKAWKDVPNDPMYPGPERAAFIPTAGIGFQLARKVKVTQASVNVRSGPGATFPVIGNAKKDAVFESTREISGWGEIGENRWIALQYTVAI